MTRKFVAMILAFALVLALACSFSFFEKDGGYAAPSVIIVPDQYSTIQEAINNAVDGDTVFVRSGIYYERVVVNKTVSLLGEEANATIVDANGTGRVFSVSRGYVNITGFTIRRSGSAYVQDAGVWIEGIGHCNVFGNVLAENDFFGVHLSYTSFNNVFDNVFTKTKIMSVVISTGNENVISRNRLENHYCGIDIHALSYDNQIVANVIRRGDYGVIVDNSYRNVISGNNITEHKWEYGYNLTGQKLGISIQECSQNIIVKNLIADNDGNGVQLIDSNVAVFYHNNLINNSRHIYASTPTPAIWDNGYPSGGNYWSDYNGTDADGDGIGDTQYEAVADIVDRYPLINPWTRLLGDINDDRTVDNFDAEMLTTTFCSREGSSRWNAEADLKSDGAIDIFDAIVLSVNFGKKQT
jgi:nitrous oxidase accessory protein